MNKSIMSPLAEYFREVEDTRIERKKSCPLIEVIVITLPALMSGPEGWENIEYYAQSGEQRFRTFLRLGNGNLPGAILKHPGRLRGKQGNTGHPDI